MGLKILNTMNIIHKLSICLALLGSTIASAQNSVRDLRYEITDTAIVFPESFQADVHQMQQNWYLQNYTVLDNNIYEHTPATDDDYITRLQTIPTTIEMPFNQVVKENIEKYVNNRRGLVETMLGLSLFYMPIFEEALEKEDVPLELRNLPIIESAMNPNAVSRAGATGLWQFMLPTARGLGMEISTLVDERRDPIVASENAARYLKQLYNTFGDWSLAIAAYNCGPGNISKALTRAGATPDNPKDFWDIYYYLPAETRGYVPGFIGATYAMEYYGKHGISPALAKRPILTDTVHVTDRLQFSAIADVLGIPMEEIRVLNPQYRKDIIPGDVRPYALRLPSQMVYNYLMNQDSIIEASRLLAPRATVDIGDKDNLVEGTDGMYRESVKWHKVKRGETIAQVAKRYGVTTSQIKKWNGLRTNKLTRGKNLKIVIREFVAPKPEPVTDGTEVKISVPEAPADTVPFIQDRVPDSLPSDIEQNEDDDEDEDPALVEDVKPQPKPAPKAATSTTYRVRKGDNLYSIAKKHGTTVDKIKNDNNLKDNNIKVGQRLKITK